MEFVPKRKHQQEPQNRFNAKKKKKRTTHTISFLDTNINTIHPNTLLTNRTLQIPSLN